jgi:hypothetical protein
MSPPIFPQTDDDNSSECSYYSLDGLQNDRWYRNIPASQIREQAKQVPNLPAPANALYPRMFHNREQLGLASHGPWTEYPFNLNKRYTHGCPGPVRLIVNSAKPNDVDVVYHPEKDVRKVCLAKYRPKGYAKGACLKPSPHNPLPSNNTFGIPQGMTYQAAGAYYYPPAQSMPAQMIPAMQTAMFYPGHSGFTSPMTTWGQYNAGYATYPYTARCIYLILSSRCY